MYGIQKIVTQAGCRNCSDIDITFNHHATTPQLIATNFLKEYYRNVSNEGWNASTYLFDPKCTVICKNKNVGTEHDLLIAFSKEYVKRANFAKLNSKWIVIDIHTMVLNVFGYIQFVSFTGHYSSCMPFSETFVIKRHQSNTVCTHHMIDF
jgi:hypothetical protein